MKKYRSYPLKMEKTTIESRIIEYIKSCDLDILKRIYRYMGRLRFYELRKINI
jgi:hypothetical protein